MANQSSSNKKSKLPTAKKRVIQSEKKHLSNKILKSKIKTSCTNLQKADAAEKPALLNIVYKLVDKAVKKGVYKKNKGSRVKSRFARVLTPSSL